MKTIFPQIDLQKETERIVIFLQIVLAEQKFSNVVIAVSSGIDSTTSLYLLRKALKPENIFVVHLPYISDYTTAIAQMTKELGIPEKNVSKISIQSMTDVFQHDLGLTNASVDEEFRLGLIMSRIRMVALYDLAKKYNALVCGTENKSEYYLGYFTRFGDEASDIEPIRHLYKTQVYSLARFLGVPEPIINQPPTAGLWQGQTDEGELGFTYEEADQVFFLHFDQGLSEEEILAKGFLNANSILKRVRDNKYKHETPYLLEES